MKIRQGFVSNSSTSSFIVKINDPFDKNFKSLEKKKINLLTKHGFYPCICPNPLFLESEYDELEKIERYKLDREEIYKNKKCPKYKNNYLGLRVVCNQDIPLEFLVFNNIPFTASVHYGYYTYVYKENGKYVYVLNNFGIQEDNDDPEKLFKKAKEMRAEGTIAYKLFVKEIRKNYSLKNMINDKY
jgi:hypothetical protein